LQSLHFLQFCVSVFTRTVQRGLLAGNVSQRAPGQVGGDYVEGVTAVLVGLYDDVGEAFAGLVRLLGGSRP